ncbi:hypothetical protein Poli38472_004309 [Pythium oligandrum]|uniref:Uncharacterized protein n=1 Tax=Pythium oligandrum TaxID=41045 RepID=A0A8K1CNV9_PYTOL|nr:hypothetical protein Poli38472_004309 [Pythium oligandrum]|eukprot:TMW66544.1 hypothetical protein Poli38472_004309 [Pythium oligandrum]
MVRKSAPSARSYNHAVGREPVARAKDEDEDEDFDEDDDNDDDVDVAYGVPMFAMKSAPSGVHYNHAVSIKPAPTAGYKTTKKSAPTAASKNHANGSVKHQRELEDSSDEEDYHLGQHAARTATRRLMVESEQDDLDDDSDDDDDESDSAMTQKVAMKTAPSAARYNSAATAKRQRAGDMDGDVEVVKTVKLPPSRVIKKADLVAPSPPPQRRSSGNDVGLLSEWLSVSELQAQEREWARLQREKRNQDAHYHVEKTEHGKRKSVRDDILAQTQGDNQSASSEMSLIEVVELLEDEDEEMSQKGEDDDDDDFMPSSSWSQKSSHKRDSKKKTDVAKKRAHHRKMMAQNGASAVNGALPVVSDTLPKARTAADTIPHWTTWRACAFAVAPTNLLCDWRMDRLSFTSTVDRPLSEYDKSGELGTKCAIVTSFGKTKQFVLTNDAVGATSTQEDMNSRVTQLLEKWSPHIRQCYERKTDAIVREARSTIRGYLQKLDVHRHEMLVSRNRGLVRARRSLDVCSAERVITKQLMRSSMLSPLEESNKLGYTIGRGESFLSEKSILAEVAVVLAPMRQLSRSTTYVGVKASVRVEDDPILRHVPYFGDHDSGDAIDVKHYGSIRKREESGPSISSGLEHELHEYMLRLVIAECGDAEIVFNSLKQVAGFTQPYTEYGEIKKLHDARRASAKRIVEVREFLSQVDNIGESSRQSIAAWSALSTLTSTLPPFAGGSRVNGALSLSERLSAPFTYFETNLLPPSGLSKKAGPLGLRNTSDYADLSETFRDLFCRMCYKYDCHEHGIEHPMPSRRVDPIYPNTRYAPVLIAKETDKNTKEGGKTDNHEDTTISDVNASAEEDDSSAETKQKNADSSVTSRPDVLDLAAEFSGVESQESVELLSSESSQAARRRSARSQTVASTLATISLESQMAHSSARQRVPRTQRSRSAVKRSKEDESEYLDNSHAMLLSDKVKTFLATDGLCSDDCWKNASSQETKGTPTRPADGGTSVEATSVFNEPNERVKDRLSATEILLLQKLRYTIGDNPCMISCVLESLTCRDVHTYLVGQQQRRPLGQGGCFSPDVGVKKTRKRGRTSTALPQNNRELLKRTRHQRLKDTSAFNHEYEPCNHEGICDFGVGCSCMKRDHMCEKACSCSRDCPNRFLGCRCSMGNCRTNACPCFVAMRECNPDLCFTCGATDMPVLIYNPELRRLGALELGICCNVNAQRGLHKKIGVSFSTTHGWGAFAREPIRRGEFIYEYNGAIISHDEAERRGSIYDKMAISFLFDLNEDAVVDAIRSGNKIKFANHAAVGQKCLARIMRIGGEHRISIWASADIQKGEELFFNYGYHGESAPDWSQVRITGSSKRGEADKQEQHDE